MKPWNLRAAPMMVVLVFTVSVVRAAEQAPELREGVSALYRGDYERAASVATSFITSHGDMASGYILRARVGIARGQYSPSYNDLREALRRAPTNVDALYYLSRVSQILSQIEYQQLYSLAPDSARVHQLLAESYQAQNNVAKSRREFEAALEADPHSREVLDALGDLERSEFRLDQAIAYYSRVAEIDPHDYTSAYGLGAAYLFRQEPRRAIEYLRRALELDTNSAAARLALGDALLRAGDAAAAAKELRFATELEPNLRQAYTLLVHAYQKLGQHHEAELALNRANELMKREVESREQTLASDDLTSPALTPDRAEKESPEQ
jgi:tetratricopeptide (TPR) repeat protein